MTDSSFVDVTEDKLRTAFDATDYMADDNSVTMVLLALRLGCPLLVEDDPGAGKTNLAKVLSEGSETDLVRMQCYEGLAAENVLYEWNYTKQLLTVQADEGGVADADARVHRGILTGVPAVADTVRRRLPPPPQRFSPARGSSSRQNVDIRPS